LAFCAWVLALGPPLPLVVVCFWFDLFKSRKIWTDQVNF
jgi:hypothetical protein